MVRSCFFDSAKTWWRSSVQFLEAPNSNWWLGWRVSPAISGWVDESANQFDLPGKKICPPPKTSLNNHGTAWSPPRCSQNLSKGSMCKFSWSIFWLFFWMRYFPGCFDSSLPLSFAMRYPLPFTGTLARPFYVDHDGIITYSQVFCQDKLKFFHGWFLAPLQISIIHLKPCLWRSQ